MISSSRKKCRLNTLTGPTTAVVEEENVLDAREPAKMSHLSPGAVDVQKALLEATRTECCVYTKYFRNLHETHELQDVEELSGSVDQLLCNLRIISAASMPFKRVIVMCSTQTTLTRHAILQNISCCMEDISISFTQQYNCLLVTAFSRSHGRD